MSNDTAKKQLVDKLLKVSQELKPIYDSTDPKDMARAAKLKEEIGVLNNKIMALDTTGSIGAGLAKGITESTLGVANIISEASPTGLLMNLVGRATGRDMRGLPSAEAITRGLEYTGNDTVQRGLFGAAKGAGSSLGMGPVMTGVNIGTNTLDELLFSGTPVTQSLVAGTGLAVGGVLAARQAINNKQVKKLLATLPENEANFFKEYMLRGQTSSDPQVAGKLNELRSNPKFAELFTVAEKAAADKATKGMRADTVLGYNNDETGARIFNSVSKKITDYRNAVKTAGGGAYEKAGKLAGDTPLVVTDKTQAKVAELLTQYKESSLPDSNNTVKFLEKLQEGLTNGAFQKKMTVPEFQAWMTDFGKKAAGDEAVLKEISVGTQKQLSAAIFKGLKDDLKAMTSSGDKTTQAVGNLLTSGSEATRLAAEDSRKFLARGLPNEFIGKTIDSYDSESLLKVMKRLTNAERDRMSALLNPEDLNRVRQVMYDDFVQTARKTLPDNTTGIDLQALAKKYNTLPAEEKSAVSFAMGANAKDFDNRMASAENFFKYQQKYGGVEEAAKINPAAVETATYGVTGGNFGVAKGAGGLARTWNFLKGGMNDAQVMSLLTSKDTRDVFRNADLSPGGFKTLDKIEKALGGPIGLPSWSPKLKDFALGMGQTAGIPLNQDSQAPIIPQVPTQAAPSGDTEVWDLNAPKADAEDNWSLGPTSSTPPTGFQNVSLEGLNPQLRDKLMAANEAYRQKYGQDLPVTSGVRTYAKQKELYDRWKAGEKGIFMPTNPYANPKDFYHNDAVDISANVPEDFLKQYGLHRPLGSRDPVHTVLM